VLNPASGAWYTIGYALIRSEFGGKIREDGCPQRGGIEGVFDNYGELPQSAHDSYATTVAVVCWNTGQCQQLHIVWLLKYESFKFTDMVVYLQ